MVDKLQAGQRNSKHDCVSLYTLLSFRDSAWKLPYNVPLTSLRQNLLPVIPLLPRGGRAMWFLDVKAMCSANFGTLSSQKKGRKLAVSVTVTL